MKKKHELQVTVPEGIYNIEYVPKKGKKVKEHLVINGYELELQNINGSCKKIMGNVYEYPVRLGNTDVLVVINKLDGKRFFDVIVNGRSTLTGDQYIPVDKIPAWMYVFLVLDCLWILLMQGAVPICAIIIAFTMTLRLATNGNKSTGYKVGMSFLIWFLESVVIGLLFFTVVLANS